MRKGFGIILRGLSGAGGLAACLLLVATGALVVMFGSWAGARPTAGETAAAGNGIYRVFVENRPEGGGVGAFAAVTGPAHPLGEGREILFSGEHGDEASASYITVRSYTTGTDYVQTTGAPASGNLLSRIDGLGSVTPIGDTGYRTVYDTATPEALRIVSEVSVEGSTAQDSAIVLRATVTNNSAFPIRIGVRYLLDFALDDDDGPAFVAGAAAPPDLSETAYPGRGTFGVFGNDGPAQPLRLFGRATLDGEATSGLVQFAYWPDAFDSAFEHAGHGRDIAQASGLDDSAVLYYFSPDESTAIVLEPQRSVTAQITLSAAPLAPEVCDNQADDDGDGLADAADPDCPVATPSPSATATPVPSPAALPRTGRQF